MDVDFDVVWADRSKPFGHFISQERNYRSKALKQADVVALLYLFRERFDQETKKNCLDYYQGMTTHDSSLSYIFHSLMYTEIGDIEEGYSYLHRSLDIDLDGKGAAEGIHIANCGGIWQGIVMGFGGFRGVIDQPELSVTPKLPAQVTSLKYNLCVRGAWYEVTIDHQGVHIQELTIEGGESLC
ncbi:Alpha,alpha-trehalose phosphorylase [compost metagenome]